MGTLFQVREVQPLGECGGIRKLEGDGGEGTGTANRPMRSAPRYHFFLT